MFRFDENKVSRLSPIGRGASGVIYPYKESENDSKKWVVKELKTNIEQLKHVVQEIVFGFNHDHPFILQIAGYHFQEPKNGDIKMYLRMPRMKRSLGDLISNNKYNQNTSVFTTENVVKWFYSLANALAYLKRKNIAHRDIKPENILLDDYDNVYLSDLGLSKFAGADITAYIQNIAGTPMYMAPENGSQEYGERLMKEPERLYSADVWSLGMTILNMCSDPGKNVPYPTNIEEIGKNRDILIEDIKQRLEQVSAIHGPIHGPKLKEILAQLLVWDHPYERLEYDKICEALQKSFPSVTDKVVAILEEKIEALHGRIFQKYRENMVNPIISVTQTLNENLDGKFRFIFGDAFSIEPRDPFSLNEEELKESIENFFKTIREHDCSFLRSIKMNFAYCSNLASETIDKIKFNWPQLYRVQKLDLDFTDCENIVQAGKLALKLDCFNGLKNLKTLSLGFGGCNSLRNTNLEELYKVINNLPKLENLQLNFQGCSQIKFEENEIKILKENLKGLEKLQEFCIDLQNCENITIPMKDNLKKELKWINNLSIK